VGGGEGKEDVTTVSEKELIRGERGVAVNEGRMESRKEEGGEGISGMKNRKIPYWLLREKTISPPNSCNRKIN